MQYDIAIIGVGPAGIQAAIHAGRRKKSVVMLGKTEHSNLFKATVENYCCQEGAVEGLKLLQDGVQQALTAGAIQLEKDVTAIAPALQGYVVTTEEGREITAKALILALGIKNNRLNVPGEKDYTGRGVSYCVECDAMFYRGKTVAVVGSGSAATSGAEFLSKIAAKVYLIPAKGELTNPDISEAVTLLAQEQLQEIAGDGSFVTGFTTASGNKYEADGVFIELGAKGVTELALNLGVELDAEQLKFIPADKKQRTNVAGIFACGDITGAPFQMAKAVGEGCVAGISAAEYCDSIKK